MAILITGITGTLGTALTELLLKTTEHEIVGVSRDEQKQRQMPVNPRLKLKIADVRDPEALARVCNAHRFTHIFHLAALKCVDTLEFHPLEALKTNVLGTQNIVDIAEAYGAKLLFTSTDKACYPVNAYGQSKALAEKIVLDAKQTVVRYGNVVGSRGSFLPNLILSLKTEGKAYYTDKLMTRYWMSVRQVAKFVHDAMFLGTDSDLPIVPTNIQSSYVMDFIDAVAVFCGVEKYDLEHIGIRPGEKLHETLTTAEEGVLRASDDKVSQFEKKSLVRFISDVMKGNI